MSQDKDEDEHPIVTPNTWQEWRAATPARLALGRAGNGMPTDETLRFGWAHAMARDAIHAAFDAGGLATSLRAEGWRVEQVQSRAENRNTYLRRPDLGRQLKPEDAQHLRALRQDCAAAPKICLVIGDGLSSLAVERHALPLLGVLRSQWQQDLTLMPVVIASQARVALADEVADALGAQLVVMLIGERPGLSSPDSLGAYMTHAPRPGCSDADRNCISNVRPAGLSYAAAAFKLAWLMREALRLGLSGVRLKDQSDLAVLDSTAGNADQGGFTLPPASAK